MYFLQLTVRGIASVYQYCQNSIKSILDEIASCISGEYNSRMKLFVCILDKVFKLLNCNRSPIKPIYLTLSNVWLSKFKPNDGFKRINRICLGYFLWRTTVWRCIEFPNESTNFAPSVVFNVYEFARNYRKRHTLNSVLNCCQILKRRRKALKFCLAQILMAQDF